MPDERPIDEDIDDLVAWATLQAVAKRTDAVASPNALGLHATARAVLELDRRAGERERLTRDGYGLVLPQRFVEDRAEAVAMFAMELGAWALTERRVRALAGGESLPPDVVGAEAVARGLFNKIARTVSDEPF